MSDVILSPADFQVFPYNGHDIRAAVIDGEPWFVAHDVEKSVTLGDYRTTYEKLAEREKLAVWVKPPAGNNYLLKLVSESGVHAITLRCHDAMREGTPAFRFRIWVTAEVLPTLRKTGTYTMPNSKLAQSEPPTYTPENPAPPEVVLAKLKEIEEQNRQGIVLCNEVLAERIDQAQSQIIALQEYQEAQRQHCAASISRLLAAVNEVERWRKGYLAYQYGVESTGRLIQAPSQGKVPDMATLVEFEAHGAAN